MGGNVFFVVDFFVPGSVGSFAWGGPKIHKNPFFQNLGFRSGPWFQTSNLHPWRLTNRTWKWWFGRWLSFLQGARILRFHVHLLGCTWICLFIRWFVYGFDPMGFITVELTTVFVGDVFTALIPYDSPLVTTTWWPNMFAELFIPSSIESSSKPPSSWRKETSQIWKNFQRFFQLDKPLPNNPLVNKHGNWSLY